MGRTILIKALCVVSVLFVVAFTQEVYSRPHTKSAWNATTAEACTTDNCRLPDCFCSGTVPPGGLSVSHVPQIVMLTFDDAVNEQNMPYYEQLLPYAKNPNGCPMSATFFNSHEWTNYYQVQLLRSQRHEIADHTITHRLPISWWATATKDEWSKEVNGQRTIQGRFGGVEDVRGFRAPFLQPGGNNQFDVLHEGGFLYDSTMSTLQFTDPPLWPYTLDYPTIQECNIPPCPNKSYPGLWEVPLIDLVDKNGRYYAMIDDFHPGSEEEAYEFLELNFNRHYEKNRAPFGVFMHATWFSNYPYTVAAMRRFLAKLTDMSDVWLVSVSQAIDWISKPTPLSEVSTFPAWQCSSPAPWVCRQNDVKYCYYSDSRGGKLCATAHARNASNITLLNAGCPGVDVEGPKVAHTLISCVQTCPAHYPWYGNPYGN